MKKFIIGILAAAAMFTVICTANPQCAFIKKDGTQCRNHAQDGSMYCWSHNHQ